MSIFLHLPAVVRLFAITQVFVLLGACGGGTSNANTVTMKEKMVALEKKGLLPQLDRSTDIGGPDADHNGIRDDLDAYIAALPISEQTKKATRQVARVQQQSLLIDLKNRPALLALAAASMASTACMYRTVEAGFSIDQQTKAGNDGDDIIFKIEAITANTPERAARYMAYMRALHGTSTRYPSSEQKVCDDQ